MFCDMPAKIGFMTKYQRRKAKIRGESAPDRSAAYAVRPGRSAGGAFGGRDRAGRRREEAVSEWAGTRAAGGCALVHAARGARGRAGRRRASGRRARFAGVPCAVRRVRTEAVAAVAVRRRNTGLRHASGPAHGPGLRLRGGDGTKKVRPPRTGAGLDGFAEAIISLSGRQPRGSCPLRCP